MTELSHHVADLDLGPNEASSLLRVGEQYLLDHFGWDRAFWTVLDEVDVDECIVLLGHAAGRDLADGWEPQRLAVSRRGDVGRADDAEAMARHDGWIYVFGSQHGGKEGPIRRREQWVGRFREADVLPDGLRVDLELVRTRYALHRAINDALQVAARAVLPMREATRDAYIEQTRTEKLDPEDLDLVRPDDWTINVEGAEFTAEGILLLGLRFPVAADGRPLIARLAGVERLFEGGRPDVIGFWAVDAIGRNGDIAGVRDLCVLGSELHLVTGDLDSHGKGSVVLDDYPEGRNTVNTHFVATIDESVTDLAATPQREFPDHPRIEGIAADGQGRFFYVSDEDETIRLRCTPLLAGD